MNHDKHNHYLNAQQHERSTYNILAKQLGEEDTRTKDSANWLKTFQQREAQVKIDGAVVISQLAKSALISCLIVSKSLGCDIATGKKYSDDDDGSRSEGS